MKLSKYLNQPYPYGHDYFKKELLLVCCLALASFLFSYLFEPFAMNVAEHKIKSIYILLLHATLPIPIAIGYLAVLNKTVKDATKWTIGKEFLHLSILLFLIGLCDFLIRDFIYTNPDNLSFRYFYEEIRNTFLVGTLLLLVILPLNLERLLNKHQKLLKQTPQLLTIPSISQTIQITTQVKSEHFQLRLEDFLFAKVEGNYIEVFCYNIGSFEKLLKRMTLKEFEEQLKAFPYVFKVHRSYIVNLQAIESISGNAQGYALRIKHYPVSTIPVARSTIEAFNQVYFKGNNQ